MDEFDPMVNQAVNRLLNNMARAMGNHTYVFDAPITRAQLELVVYDWINEIVSQATPPINEDR